MLCVLSCFCYHNVLYFILYCITVYICLWRVKNVHKDSKSRYSLLASPGREWQWHTQWEIMNIMHDLPASLLTCRDRCIVTVIAYRPWLPTCGHLTTVWRITTVCTSNDASIIDESFQRYRCFSRCHATVAYCVGGLLSLSALGVCVCVCLYVLKLEMTLLSPGGINV